MTRWITPLMRARRSKAGRSSRWCVEKWSRRPASSSAPRAKAGFSNAIFHRRPCHSAGAPSGSIRQLDWLSRASTANTGIDRRQLACTGQVRDLCTDRVKQHLGPTLRNTAPDKNDPAAAIIGRPALQPGGRVKDMLDAVNHRWPVRALRNIHDALEAQEIGPAMLGECFEKQRQRDGPDRLGAHDGTGFDAGVMRGMRMSLGLPGKPV